LIINKFNSYLYQGGFPETVDLLYREQAELLRTYFYVMLYKDLIERYKISSVTVLKFFIGKLADNLTKPFSLNKIYNELHSQGFKLDKNSLYELIEYFENIYLSFKTLKFDNSFASRSRADKKAYFIDNGLVNILTNRFSEDKGKLLENAVFLFLRNKYGDLFNDTIFYYKNGKECDFVVFDRDKPSYCIQVCYDISQSATKEREIAGLLSALKYFNMETGYIITAEQEENLFIENKQIFIKPAYKIMIDNEIKK